MGKIQECEVHYISISALLAQVDSPD